MKSLRTILYDSCSDVLHFELVRIGVINHVPQWLVAYQRKQLQKEREFVEGKRPRKESWGFTGVYSRLNSQASKKGVPIKERLRDNRLEQG